MTNKEGSRIPLRNKPTERASLPRSTDNKLLSATTILTLAPTRRMAFINLVITLTINTPVNIPTIKRTITITTIISRAVTKMHRLRRGSSNMIIHHTIVLRLGQKTERNDRTLIN